MTTQQKRDRVAVLLAKQTSLEAEGKSLLIKLSVVKLLPIKQAILKRVVVLNRERQSVIRERLQLIKEIEAEELQAKKDGDIRKQQEIKQAQIDAQNEEKQKIADEILAIEKETERIKKLAEGDFEDEVDESLVFKTSQGQKKDNNTKTYLIIGGVALALVGGFIAYKKFKK
jgi:LPXTG-motif cell wall-anchored protein